MEERIPIPQPEELQQGQGTAIAASGPAEDAAPADFAVSVSSGEESSDEEAPEFEFEFPFVSRDSPAGTAAPADELFADGRIRSFYPVFGRGVGGHVHGGAARAAPVAEPRVRGQLGRLFLEETRERNSSASSTASTTSSSGATDDDVLEGAAPESYCVWRPGGGSASASPRKSGSTGSMARWRRISDLVVGRSHSDGKEKFVFFAASAAAEAGAPAGASGKGDRSTTRPRPRTASAPLPPPHAAAHHGMAYLAKGGPGGTPRRTFLPYREELVGFFANVNGVSRSHQHPF